jgi:hypothetical protein
MSSKVASLTKTSQLLQKNRFIQIGSDDAPCRVLFGLSNIDQDKRYRSIQVIPSEQQLDVFKNFDYDNMNLLNIVKEFKETSYIRVKLDSENVKVKYIDGSISSGSIDDIRRGQECKLIVKPIQWEMNDKTGISLRAFVIQLISPSDIEEFDFVE